MNCLPNDVLRLIFALCDGGLAHQVCRRWRDVKGSRKVYIEHYSKDLSTLRRILDWGCPREYVIATLLVHPDQKAAEWCWENLGSWSDKICFEVAKGGFWSLLMRLQNRGFKISSDVYTGAARGGHVNIIDWADKLPWGERPSWTGRAYGSAALGGHVHVMQWLSDKSYSSDEKSMKRCCKQRGPEAREWVATYGIPKSQRMKITK